MRHQRQHFLFLFKIKIHFDLQIYRIKVFQVFFNVSSFVGDPVTKEIKFLPKTLISNPFIFTTLYFVDLWYFKLKILLDQEV